MKFTSLLTILFIGLKLTGFINWNWFLVLSPIIISGAVILLIFIATAILNSKSKKII